MTDCNGGLSPPLDDDIYDEEDTSKNGEQFYCYVFLSVITRTEY